jgi:cytochrome c oxidase accessory protein FixG
MMEEKTSNQATEGSFRDRIATVDREGKRNWVYAKKPKGKLFNWRRITAIGLLLFFFAAPFIKYKGEPILLLNILERKFILFGVVFWPQDFHLVVLSIITLLVFIVLFTVIYGRLFCGWVCPQTIFMEFVFRRIEYMIEGDAAAQKRLDKGPWDFNKIWRKTLKQTVFFLISFVTANIFLSYIVGMDQLQVYYSEGLAVHTGGLAGLLIFSGMFYFVFAFFREQVCAIACPYGRLQGVLIDKKTIVVAYDYVRGEPRGPLNKTTGDCVACNSCVVVCPAGIDIRNGTQMECVNCTACIDACNTVMARVKKPKGLIRYDSEEGIATGKHKLFNARSIAYSAALMVLLVFVGVLFALRGDFEATILRASGSLYQDYGNDSVSNIFNFNIVNKVRTPVEVDFRLESHKGSIKYLGDRLTVDRGEVGKGTFLVIIPLTELQKSKTPITIGLYTNGEKVQDYHSSFVGPNSLDN